MNKFKLKAEFKPAGDQIKAIKKLLKGIGAGYPAQTLLGVTGSGKTFTMANVIAALGRPTLVITHNKTLAAQLCHEYRSFFPQNAVEYFVSYYDYYQPEAYLPHSDIYIEKEAQINEEIDRLRHSATSSLLSRKDVIVVASVSAIYNLGSPEEYHKNTIELIVGQNFSLAKLIENLVALHYFRTPGSLKGGNFRVRGNVLEIILPSRDKIYRLEYEFDKIQKIWEIDPINRHKINELERLIIFPAKHYLVAPQKRVFEGIKNELSERVAYFKKIGKELEAHRLRQRTEHDLEMIGEIGYCSGIENYSRWFDGRLPGEPAHTLLDYFPKDFLLIIDESHVAIPQIKGMYEGDRARKQTLIDYGFRLPSAIDNRPLRFNEFEKKLDQAVFTSATPGSYEDLHSSQTVEQIIRPTGLIDPEIVVRKTENQINDLMVEIEARKNKNERVLVTTLTRKMAEELSEYLKERKIAAAYLHFEVETLDRIKTLQDLRSGKFDCLVGINLLREGLDLPEVSLVAILDADKEGFLRSKSSLIQTIGRAARNVSGKVILYADNITNSMARAIDETNRRRKIQMEYNEKNKITPKTIKKNIKSIIDGWHEQIKKTTKLELELSQAENIDDLIKSKTLEMTKAARELEFELAAILRDEIVELKKREREISRERII